MGSRMKHGDVTYSELEIELARELVLTGGFLLVAMKMFGPDGAGILDESNTGKFRKRIDAIASITDPIIERAQKEMDK